MLKEAPADYDRNNAVTLGSHRCAMCSSMSMRVSKGDLKEIRDRGGKGFFAFDNRRYTSPLTRAEILEKVLERKCPLNIFSVQDSKDKMTVTVARAFMDGNYAVAEFV